jgi:hypothetical protein
MLFPLYHIIYVDPGPIFDDDNIWIDVLNFILLNLSLTYSTLAHI